MRIKLTLSYDGTDFCGWQVQNKGRSVQGVLEQAIFSATGFKSRPVGSGRTDAGVQALGQVAHLDIPQDCAIPPEKLFKGVALGLCREIEKSADMLSTFNGFSESQKKIYALYFVFEDGAEKLSKFFKINGKPLTDYAKSAVDEIYGGKIASVFGKEYLAYDEDDETTSLIPAEIEADDTEFASLTDGADMFAPAAEYIIENINYFTKE